MTQLSLTERVHNLAPELFEEIYEAFIATNEDEPVLIDATYKFPIQLHIDPSTRHCFAKKYYRRPFKSTISSLASTTSQQEEDSDDEDSDDEDSDDEDSDDEDSDDEEDEDPNLRKWLSSVPAEHRAFVRRIEAEQADHSFCNRPLAHRRIVEIMRVVHDEEYHMPDLVVFASWSLQSDTNAETVLVRLEGYRVGSWQSSWAARTRRIVLAWPWNGLGVVSADINETRLVVLKKPTQAA